MSCDTFSDSIGALIDGTIGPEAQRALDEHLASCVTCRALVADFRRIHREAASLPRMTPPDTLWMKVRGRLEAEMKAPAQVEAAGLKARPATGAATGWREAIASWFRPLVVTPMRTAAFATAIVLVLAVATTYVLLRQPASQRASQPAGQAATAQPDAAAQAPSGAAAGNAGDQEFVQSVEMELRLAEQHYEKAIAGLEQIAKTEQGSLDPQVAALLQKNLGIIDQAIRDSRVALQSQPTSQVAQTTLFEAFRRKVALLQDTITLINEMRKGDQAGAARALQNLNRG
jgi:anti-sigma factor RsiW